MKSNGITLLRSDFAARAVSISSPIPLMMEVYCFRIDARKTSVSKEYVISANYQGNADNIDRTVMLRLLIDQDLDQIILRVPKLDVITAHQVGLSIV